MHKLNRRLVLVALAVLLAACGRSVEQQMLLDTGEKVILPLHESFLANSLALSQSVERFCARTQRNTADLAALRDRWIAAMNAWEGIQNIQFGPVTEDNHAWKVQFWPDRKNLIARKTQQFVKRDDISLATLQEASVVIQGLSAIEYLLYDTPAETLLQDKDAGRRYCEHLHAAALNLHEVADRLYRGWHPASGNFLAVWTQPGPDNIHYPDAATSTAALIETLVYGLEVIRRDKLERPLALATQGQPNSYLLEWWRSRQSLPAILINLRSLQQLFNAGGGTGLNTLLVERGNRQLAGDINRQFDQALSLGAAIEGIDAPSRGDTPLALRQLYELLGKLLSHIKHDVPAALNITLGFNANDGD